MDYPFFCHSSAFNLVPRYCIGVITIISRRSAIGACNFGQITKNSFSFQATQDYAEAIGWFYQVLQTCVQALGIFHGDSSSFPTQAGVCSCEWLANRKLVFESIVNRWKSNEPRFSNPFTYWSPSKRWSYSLSSRCSFLS